MALRNWYKIHKWIWIFTGIFLLGWLVSGILMLMPQRLIGADSRVPAITVDYEQVTIGPVKAINIVRQELGVSTPARRIGFRAIHDRPVYSVILETSPEIIVDAATGDIFSMSPELAAAIVAYNFPNAEASLIVTKIDRHSLTYPFGRLPVYRLTSSNNSPTAYFVDVSSGKVFRSTLFTRIRSAVITLHDFSTLKLIVDNNRLQKLLLLMASLAALVGAIIGYYMALPRRRLD